MKIVLYILVFAFGGGTGYLFLGWRGMILGFALAAFIYVSIEDAFKEKKPVDQQEEGPGESKL